MSRKHFVAIASVLASLPLRTDMDEYTHMSVVRAMADVCGSFNDNFDWQTFRRASGVDNWIGGKYDA